MSRETTEGSITGKRKLLIIHEAMGGCGRNVIDIVNGVDSSKFEVTVVYGTSRIDDYYRKWIPTMNEHATLIPAPYLTRSLNPHAALHAIRKLRSIIKQVEPDIVHCHSSIAGTVGRLATAGLHVDKVFYSPHAYSFQAWEFSARKKRLFALLERILSHIFTTCTFNVSAGERTLALEHRLDTPDKFKVVYNGIPDTAIPSRQEALTLLGLDKLPEDSIIVGSTVRLTAQKDPTTFLKIAQRVISTHPRMHFVCVGDGELRNDANRFIEENGLSSNVHLLGYRNDAERIVAAFDIYLLTSLYEGLPYSLVESLRAGVPIVATDVTGNNEVVRPGVNGYLFPIKNVEKGAEMVLKVYNTHFPAQQVRETYLDKFTVKKMLSDIQQSYLG